MLHSGRCSISSQEEEVGLLEFSSAFGETEAHTKHIAVAVRRLMEEVCLYLHPSLLSRRLGQSLCWTLGLHGCYWPLGSSVPNLVFRGSRDKGRGSHCSVNKRAMPGAVQRSFLEKRSAFESAPEACLRTGGISRVGREVKPGEED